jgi:diamine N-acetyltransferase
MEFKIISKDNWLECINMWTKNDKFIASNLYSIAEAQFYPKAISKAIYESGVMVGYIMYGEDENDESIIAIDRLMIGEKHRRNGYAAAAIKKVIKYAGENGYRSIKSSTAPENGPMRSTFESNGFITMGEMDGNEIIYYYSMR